MSWVDTCILLPILYTYGEIRWFEKLICPSMPNQSKVRVQIKEKMQQLLPGVLIHTRNKIAMLGQKQFDWGSELRDERQWSILKNGLEFSNNLIIFGSYSVDRQAPPIAPGEGRGSPHMHRDNKSSSTLLVAIILMSSIFISWDWVSTRRERGLNS